MKKELFTIIDDFIYHVYYHKRFCLLFLSSLMILLINFNMTNHFVYYAYYHKQFFKRIRTINIYNYNKFSYL